jgi:YidC/Oxa1 family membrane protein insertase
LGPAFSYDGENYDKRSFSEIEEVEFRTSTSGGWISMIQHYFLTSLLPNQSSNSLLQGKKNKNDGSFSVGFVERPKRLLQAPQ